MLSLARIEEIQQELLADDIDIDYVRRAIPTRESARLAPLLLHSLIDCHGPCNNHRPGTDENLERGARDRLLRERW